jgi:hypothetical protein
VAGPSGDNRRDDLPKKKKDAKTDVDPTGQIMPSLVGVFFTLGVYGILLTRHANGRIYLHREGGELPNANEGTFITETEEREGVTDANEGA